MAVKFPYKLCRLVHHDYDLKKRWYVLFYAWNVATETLDRKRIFDPINRAKTVQKREAIAKAIMAKTDADLKAGKVLGKRIRKKVAGKDPVHTFSLIRCINYFVEKKQESKRRKNYLRRFSDNLVTHLKGYYEENNIDDIRATEVDSEFFEDFCNYLRDRMAAKTFNNYRGDLITVLNFINKVRPGTIDGKPWEVTDKLKVVKKKHPAFSDQQIAAIIKKAKTLHYFDMVFFIQVMYYTLARSAEIRSLKIQDIDLPNNRIVIHGDAAKNWREEYVSIPPALKKAIVNYRLDLYPSDHFIFGIGSPGVKHVADSYFYSRMKTILKSLGYDKINPNFSVYSCKHSGAVALYKATKDIWAVKTQCRHESIKQTEDYLRDLDMLRNSDPVMKWKGVI